MTNDECRTALKRIAGYMCAKKDLEALTYAMNELEHISSGLVKNSKELEKDFGELDCISRKRAIERLRLNLPISDGADNSRDRHRYMQCLADIQVIRELPSVTPQEPRWIPVSERLPKDLEPVNITWINHDPEPYYSDIKDKPFTATGVYFNGQWYWWSTLCTDILAEYSHNYDDIIDDAIEVTAWMPMPEPYKAETEDT